MHLLADIVELLLCIGVGSGHQDLQTLNMANPANGTAAAAAGITMPKCCTAAVHSHSNEMLMKNEMAKKAIDAATNMVLYLSFMKNVTISVRIPGLLLWYHCRPKTLVW